MREATIERTNVHDLEFNFIFVTKDAVQVINDDVIQEFDEYLRKWARQKKYKLVEVKGGKDYLHLIVALTPQQEIPLFVKQVKTACVKHFASAFPELSEELPENRLWMPSYCVITENDEIGAEIAEYLTEQRSRKKSGAATAADATVPDADKDTDDAGDTDEDAE